MKKLSLILMIGLIISTSSSYAAASEFAEDYIDMATNYCISGNYREALNYLNKILAVEPNNQEVLELKRELIRISSPNSKPHLTTINNTIKESSIYKSQGNKEKELAVLMADSNSKNFWSNYLIAEYYRASKQYTNAINYYSKSLDIKPNFAQCYIGMAVSQYETKNYKSALISMNNYISYNQDSAFAYALRAKINLALNLYTDAEVDINKAVLMSDDINYKFLQGKILYHKGNFRYAKEILEPLSEDIKNAEIFKYLGLCDYAIKDYPSALLNIDKAIILSDDDKTLNSKYNEIKALINKS